jgi:hypothetical protein
MLVQFLLHVAAVISSHPQGANIQQSMQHAAWIVGIAGETVRA